MQATSSSGVRREDLVQRWGKLGLANFCGMGKGSFSMNLKELPGVLLSLTDILKASWSTLGLKKI